MASLTAVGLIVGFGGWVIATWLERDTQTSTNTLVGPTVNESELPGELVAPDAPDEMRFDGVYRRRDESRSAIDPIDGPALLLAEDGARVDAGRWIAVTTEWIAEPIQAGWDPMKYSEWPEAQRVSVGSVAGIVLTDPFALVAREVVEFGPVEGYKVIVTGNEMAREEVLEIAERVRFDGARLELAPPKAPSPLSERPIDLDWIALSDARMWDRDLVSVHYTDDETGSRLMISSEITDAATFVNRVEFEYSDVRPVPLRSTTAYMVTSPMLMEPQLIWHESGREITMSGISEAELIRAAESVRVATDDELVVRIPELTAEEIARLEEPESFSHGGVGEFADGSTWIVRLGTNSAGYVTVRNLIVDSMLSANSFAENAAVLEPPVTEIVVLSDDMGMRFEQTVTAIAPIDVRTPVLRIAFDDGKVVDHPLNVLPEIELAQVTVAVDGSDWSAVLLDGTTELASFDPNE